MNRITLTLLASSIAITAAACGSDGDNDNLPAGLECTAMCSDDQICAGSTCESAFNRMYTITVESITFAQRDAEGDCWDEPGCGAPDPQLEIKVGDDTLAEIEDDDDKFEATYNRSFDIFIEQTSKLKIELYDEDLGNNDLAVACEFDTINGSLIRGGDLSCQSNGSMIDAKISAATTVTP